MVVIKNTTKVSTSNASKIPQNGGFFVGQASGIIDRLAVLMPTRLRSEKESYLSKNIVPRVSPSARMQKVNL